MMPAEALATIPGWSAARFERLDGGLNNQAWLVESDGRRAVLKADSRPRRPPLNRRDEEARIQAMVATAGLAAPVIFSSETILLTEYLEGEVWSGREFTDDRRLDALARSLRTLHSLPPAGRPLDIRAAARGYAAHVRGVPAASIDAWLRVVEAGPAPETIALCHNDLVAANILSTPGIRFLDWEYAGDNDPAFDLAIVVAHHHLSRARADRLLGGYHEAVRSEDRERLAEHVRVYGALNRLWEAARESP